MSVPHSARRLLVALIALVVFDWFVPGIRDRLEAARYEQPGSPTRFENSDFFALGPLTQYLHEHPSGRRPRTAFIGSSVSFGYGLDVRDTLPAVYERLSPGEKVLNLSVNGLGLSGAYLIAKAVIDAVDTIFIVSRPGVPNGVLRELIPVSDADLQRFKWNPVASRPLSLVADRWRLYRDTYRIQAALFGTSSRQYIYLHKGEIARSGFAWIRGSRAANSFVPAEQDEEVPQVTATMPISDAPSGWTSAFEQDTEAFALLAELARAARERGKRIVVVQITDDAEYVPRPVAAAFNAEFSPHAVIVNVDRSPSAKIDKLHFSRGGAAAAARALRRVTTELR